MGTVLMMYSLWAKGSPRARSINLGIDGGTCALSLKNSPLGEHSRQASKTKRVQSWRERRQVGGNSYTVIGDENKPSPSSAWAGVNPAIDGRRPPAPAAPDPYFLPPRPWPRSLIIQALKVRKSCRFVKADLLAWLRGKEQMAQGAYKRPTNGLTILGGSDHLDGAPPGPPHPSHRARRK